MTDTAAAPRGKHPQRRLRNYLLDTRFQVKYTSMVVGVTLLVAGVLGAVAYDQSHAQTEMMQLNMATSSAELTPEVQEFIEESAREYDRNFLMSIILGVLAMTTALGVTGIVITHRVVGPAYKLKSLFRDVAQGHLRVYGRLRQGDELLDVFLEFEAMIEKLRAKQREEIDQLDLILARARDSGPSELVTELEALRARMEDELAEK